MNVSYLGPVLDAQQLIKYPGFNEEIGDDFVDVSLIKIIE